MGATRNARMLCAGFSAALLVAFASPAHSLPPDEKHGGPITGTGHGSVTTCMQTDQSLVGGNGGTELQMVAIGDSYVWGNGLRSADKFRTLVQQQLSQSLQRPVRSVVYAHSDATLKPDSSLTNAPRPGDVGGSYPTIEQQADCVPNPANVDFILMDGCINDLPAFNIADPTAPPESIAKQVASKCLPMAEVLAKILARFPKARVVLVGYHLLYSEQTPADLLPSVYRHLDVSAISPLLAIAISLGVQVVRDRVAQNSWTFYTESNRSHAAAVAAANAADPHRPASGRPRASFVPVPVRAQNAYGAPDTYLWLIPVPPTTDDMYPARVPMCDQAFPRDFAHNAVCRENSGFHPNVRGARAIASAIIPVALNLFAQSIPSMAVRVVPRPDAGVRPWTPVKMTVNAYDSETRQPISNVVVEIDGRQVATNPGGELTHTFEPRRRVVGRQSELVSTAVMITRAPKYAAVTNTINLMVPRLRVQAVYDKGKADGKTPIPLVIRAEDAESNQPVQGRIFIDGVATQLVTNQTVMYPVPVVRRLLIGRPRGTGDQIAVNPLVNWWVVADNGHYSDTRVVSPSDD